MEPNRDYTCPGRFSGCEEQSPGPARVHVPFRVDEIAAISEGQVYCASGPPNGYLCTVTQEVYDNFGLPYKIGGAKVSDAIVIGTPNNLDITSADVTVPGSAVTDSNGQFGPDY